MGRIRIIAGCWRGRFLDVPEYPGLRPTPARVRETLFNWLAPFIVKARCLDLFAGTGVLGFEALSRGALQVHFIDSHPATLNIIKKTAQRFETAAACEFIAMDAIKWLAHVREKEPAFDIIFLDPPFASVHLPSCLKLLEGSTLVNHQTRIYCESAQPLHILPQGWQLLKQKTAGDVVYHLMQGAQR